MLLKRWIWNALKSADTEDLLRVLNPKLRDLAGVLNHPGYRVRAYRSSTQAVATATWVTMIGDTEAFDVGSIHSSSTGVITIPADGAGPWLFVGLITWAANATGSRRARLAETSGPTALAVVEDANPDATIPTTLLVSSIEQTAGGETYGLQGWQDSGGNLNMATGREQTYFAGTRLLGRISG